MSKIPDLIGVSRRETPFDGPSKHEKLSDKPKIVFLTLLVVTNGTNTISIMYWGYILMVLS